MDYSKDLETMYGNGAIYDLQQELYGFYEDREFWRKWASASGQDVLELGCGTGRAGLFLINAGLNYTGLDIVEGMLAEFRKKLAKARKNADLTLGDIRSFTLNRKFDSVLLPYNGFCHLLNYVDAGDTLSCVSQHLRPNGIFAFDVFNPDLEYLSRQSPQKRVRFTYPENPFRIVETLETHNYNRKTQINHCVYYHRFNDGREERVHFDLRQYFPQEINAILEFFGFRIMHKFGDFQESEFDSGSTRQIIICRQEPGRCSIRV